MLHILKIIATILKKTCEGIRSLINIKNPVNPRIAQLNIYGIEIDNPKQVANEVNNFFVNVGPNMRMMSPKFQIFYQTISLKIEISLTSCRRGSRKKFEGGFICRPIQ